MIKQRTILSFILLLSLVFLSGCQVTYTVRNAKVSDIAPEFKDYIGMHGYNITYQNDKTGSYNVDMGNVYVSGSSSATKTTTTIVQPSDSSTGRPMTAYEQTSWNSVNDPARYERAGAAVSITQKGSDVVIFIDTNSAGGTMLNDIKDYIKSLGYKVD